MAAPPAKDRRGRSPVENVAQQSRRAGLESLVTDFKIPPEVRSASARSYKGLVALRIEGQDEKVLTMFESPPKGRAD